MVSSGLFQYFFLTRQPLKMKKLTLEKTFPAPVERVWEAFVTPDLLKVWWAPPGMHCTHPRVDLRPGGLLHYCFQGEGETAFWGRGIYQLIQAPHFLSFLDSFADEQGHAVPPVHYGMPGDEVRESLVEFQFRREGPHTRMTATMDNPYGSEMTEQMIEGWHGMFDKLVAMLQKEAPVD
jgi:uncharacterized protein YndB with AHSA1/START domain